MIVIIIIFFIFFWITVFSSNNNGLINNLGKIPTLNSGGGVRIAGAPYDANIAEIIKGMPDDGHRKVIELELKEERDKYVAMLKEPTADGKCLDPNYPYLDKSINKCVQCFTNSYNCLTGWQRCLYGFCNIKPSPACSFYPSLLTGLSMEI